MSESVFFKRDLAKRAADVTANATRKIITITETNTNDNQYRHVKTNMWIIWNNRSLVNGKWPVLV